MRSLFILMVYLTSGGVNTFNVTGHEGGDVIISCKYDARYKNHRKYLCKGSWSSCSSNIKADSNTSPEPGHKFSLYDNPSEGNFMVLITQLTKEDSGYYKCVVDNVPYPSTDLQLEMKKALTGEGNPKTVVGLHGGSTELSCTFSETNKHRTKFLCHRQRKLTCIKLTPSGTQKRKIQTVSSGKKEGQLPSKKKEEKFSVTLFQLNESDAGEYWCGVGADGGESITLIKNTQIFIETQVTGYKGGDVQIICPYHPEDSGKTKLLCKDECKGNNKPLIKTQRGLTQAAKGRFSLHDSPTAGVFTVTITGLEAEDSGKYWCGTNGTPVFIFDYYTELQVTPREASKPSSSAPSSSWSLASSSSSPQLLSASTSSPPSSSAHGAAVVVCVSLTAVALLLGILVIIIYTCRKKRTRAAAAAVPLSQITPAPFATPEVEDDYENDPAAPTLHKAPTNTPASESVYQSLNADTLQQDSVYQHLNPNTGHGDSVYQSLNPDTNHQDSVYQSLHQHRSVE